MIRRIAAALLLLLAATAARAEVCRADLVELRGDWGQARFSVEVADDEQERARGLMFRDSLPRGAGMLFVYDHPQRVAFWMKNTRIPLDMIFLDRTGVVTRVHVGAIPGDLTAIDGGDGVFAVLEINGELARRYGIGPGTVMRHPVFAGGPAAWPC
ncbi:DUF192 domain-containing protein [Pseudodonghicola flavimaris]|uniref:DUF192 domain-containing protein n=1 Tax=Pseudodonghicola flavimaris TaxID=3050036 RepID=A0ABT7EVT3_9RHOB|nr:DUF192 domain-containing protein [Pseudodonghicola flavimaris]MDK3016449.1 DUF192 domain-containing protein [Pseudodonghicola flavimaris]